MADLAAIRDEISRAIPMTDVYASRADRLGVGYSAFCKLVAKYAPDAKPIAFSAKPQGNLDIVSRPSDSPNTGRRPTFNHEPKISPERAERIFGKRDKP
jgi:hypothetical protein